jgi:SAM-dependent MidA family methyltransferase
MSNPPNNFSQQLKEQTQKLGQLPKPDVAARAHSEKLIAHIRHEIDAAGGSISFARYMELALMAPGLGYYSAGSHKLGAQGDFVTAPEISPLFSRCVARQCQQVIETLRHEPGGVDVLEFGAGSGVMAADILLELEQRQALPDHYYILELSGDLRQRQRDTIASRAPQWLEKVHWLDTLPAAGFRGVMLANEVVDAMPVHRVMHTDAANSAWQEYYVTWRDERFQWQLADINDERLQHALHELPGQLPVPYSTEVNLALAGWIAALANVLESGLVLLVDYGFPRHEYYHAQRAQGTLMCHYRHRAHDDPFVYPGLQDITAHVDFTALAEAAVQAGLDVSGYCAQAHFLLSCQLDKMVAACDPQDPAYLAITQQVRTLTSPEEMGELFKVIALTKSLSTPLMGFSFRDQREKL